MTWSRRVWFEDWFQKKNFAIKDAIYQSWLTLKRASIVTEAEALDALIAESIPKNLKRSKAKRNLGYPPNAARWDCTGSEWRWWGQGVRSKRNQETLMLRNERNLHVVYLKFMMNFEWNVLMECLLFPLSSTISSLSVFLMCSRSKLHTWVIVFNFHLFLLSNQKSRTKLKVCWSKLNVMVHI